MESFASLGALIRRLPFSCSSSLLGKNPAFCSRLPLEPTCGQSFVPRRFARTYNMRVTVDLPWNVKINWAPPPRSLALKYIPRNSGDLEKFDPVEYRKDLGKRGELVPPPIRNSRMFASADPITKDLLTVEFVRNKEIYDMYKEEMIRKVQRHPLDFTSLPAEIGALTAHVRWLQWLLFRPDAAVEDAPVTPGKTLAPSHFFKPRHRFALFQRSGLIKAIDERRDKLALLRTQDYKYFEFVLEKLQIVYKPLPVYDHKIRRKECLRRLAAEYVLLLKKERRLAYAQELEEQKEPFLLEKIETLKWIQQEETELMLKPTVTEEDVAGAKAQLAEHRQRVAASKALAEAAAKELARSRGDDEIKEAKRKPEDVLAPSKFPVGLWPYDVYQMDEDVLVKPLNSEFKGFQELEVLDERLYDERVPREAH